MEIVVTLSELNRKESYKEANASSLLFGSKFSLRFSYTYEELKEIVKYCKENDLKSYISIDAFIFEDDIEELKEYLAFLSDLDIDGIYYNDMAVLALAKDYGFENKLIYDPDTLMANSIDTSFYASQNIKVVLDREITFDEVKKIVNKLDGNAIMQVFGHSKLSYSKRRFLTNYFSFINKDVDVVGKKNISIREEKRDYRLPIIEDEYGTRIYSNYVINMFDEINEIKEKLDSVIVDDTFLEKDLVFDAIRILNGNEIDLEEKYPNIEFSTGFLYQKTDKVKQ